MAKFTPDATLDAMLDVLADNCDRVDVCSTQPTTYTHATSTYTLGNYTLTAGAGGGDWVIADGDSSGRKLTLQAQTGNNATASGTALHLAFTNGTDTLYHVTTVTSETTNSGSPLDISAVDVAEISDVA